MRIDRFLKLARLVKRRTLAAEMVDIGAVRLNARQVKPAAEVKMGDAIEIAFPRRVLTAEVVCVDEKLLKRGETAVTMLEERRIGEEERPW